VFSDLYRIAVPRLYSTLHTHSEPDRLWSVCLLTTSSSELWRFPKVLLCSIPDTDFREYPFHALG